MSTDRPFIHATPGIRFGRPNIRGISVDAITGMVLGEKDVDVAADKYDLTRGEVLVACWWAAVYGEPRLRRLWGTWADGVYPLLAARMPVDYDAVPDPPLELVSARAPELSPRELQVLHAIAVGRTSPQIAADLHLSPNTVKTVIGRLYRKLGVHTRLGAVNAARELGLLDEGGER